MSTTFTVVPVRTSETDVALIVELHKDYVQRREKLNDRRAARNGFYMVFLTSLLAGLVLVQRTPFAGHPAWVVLPALVGAILCGFWYWNLHIIEERVRTIYAVLREMERSLPYRPYTREVQLMAASGPRSPMGIIYVEKLAPVVLCSAFLAVVTLAFLL